ncbi:MAG: hypothetical protein WA510_29005 [Acidobacteriaceae bacterium]
MMPTDTIPTGTIPTEPASCRNPPTSPGERIDDFLRVRLAVIAALEASLQRSRKALLAMDIDGIEGGTKEQVDLVRDLAAAPRALMPPAGRPRKNALAIVPAYTAALLEELFRSEGRLREAARLQAALLARARYKLRVLTNMLAGASVTYGPALARNRASVADGLGAPGRRRSESCRA